MRVGGGANPEFDELFTRTIVNYLADPSAENAMHARQVAAKFWQLKPGIPSVGPFLGMLDGIDEKNPKIHGRWRYRSMIWFMRLLLPKWRPGWNDYWMMRWQLTHGEAALLEIHHRATHFFMEPDLMRNLSRTELDRLHAVWESAAWMVNSYRRQDPAFHSAMLEVEQRCVRCAQRPTLTIADGRPMPMGPEGAGEGGNN
jgi:hypothetical protein